MQSEFPVLLVQFWARHSAKARDGATSVQSLSFLVCGAAGVVLKSPLLGPLVGLGRLDAVFVKGASSHNRTTTLLFA